MEGYNNVFQHSTSVFNATPAETHDQLFQSFRTQFELFGFIDNGDAPPDDEAVVIATNINEPLYRKYLAHNAGRKHFGYGDLIPQFPEYSNVDSRHVMMSVHLFDQLRDPIADIVEIGGGFANWIRLNSPIQRFKTWTMIDLPHLGKLQTWCMNQDGIDSESYQIVSALDYDSWAASKKKIGLVIGTHSVSEFAWDIFVEYFEKVVRKAEHFYYAYHNTMPSTELIQAKLRMIEGQFRLVSKMVSEHGNVSNCLYVNRDS